MKYLYLFTLIFSFNYLIADEVRDPYENFNRKTFEFNEKLDENILKPIARTYSKFPPKIKIGVSNFFNNLEDVETSINQFLQGKPKKSINDFSRFLINSTIGLGGFIDVASKIGSRPVSSFSSVTFHMTDADVNIALKTIDAIETRERLLDVESLLSGDKYSFVKDAYIQSMNYEIADGIDVQDDFIDDMEDFLID